MAPLLRGRIASKGSGEDPEGDLSLPRVCAEAAPAAVPVLCRRRAPAARSEAPVPLASRKNGPAFAGQYRAKGKWRESGGRSPSPGYAQKQPLRQCRSCHRRRARPSPGPEQTRPLQAAKRPRFCGTVSRQREVERVRRATSLSPGYAQKQPRRPCRSCHRRRARPPPGPARLCPLQAAKRPRFCRAVLRQREAERIWRAISFARVLDTSCSGVSPR